MTPTNAERAAFRRELIRRYERLIAERHPDSVHFRDVVDLIKYDQYKRGERAYP